MRKKTEGLKEWEIKFDEEQKKKEEELIKKFYSNELKIKKDDPPSDLEKKINERDIDDRDKN